MLERADHRITLRRARDKRRRLRRKLDIKVAPVEVDHAMLELLIRLGWLQRDMSEDRHSVARAIERMLHETSSPAGPHTARKL
jgi:hypothetical protein